MQELRRALYVVPPKGILDDLAWLQSVNVHLDVFVVWSCRRDVKFDPCVQFTVYDQPLKLKNLESINISHPNCQP